MQKYKKRIFWLTSIVVSGFLVYAAAAGFYPVAFANWSPITAKELKEGIKISSRYYQKSLETYGQDTAVLSSKEAQKEIQRAVFDKLIENLLIHQELEKRLPNGELRNLVDNKIRDFFKDEQSQKAVEILYGLSMENFKEKILTPQAEAEILEGRLFWEKQNLADWLKEKKKRAKVIILTPQFAWNGENVIVK